MVAELGPTVKNEDLWRAFRPYKSIKGIRIIIHPEKNETYGLFLLAANLIVNIIYST